MLKTITATVLIFVSLCLFFACSNTNTYYNIPAVDEAPRFPGCIDHISEKELERCTLEKLYQFIQANKKYPQQAASEGIEGNVIIQFIVLKDGRITSAKVIEDIGYGCGEEALRVVRAMPNWIPGTKKEKVVNVYATVRVPFHLE